MLIKKSLGLKIIVWIYACLVFFFFENSISNKKIGMVEQRFYV